MQVVQRLVTLRDKLSGLDDGIQTRHHVTNIAGGALAASSFIDTPRAYADGPARAPEQAVQRVLIAPSFQFAMTLMLLFGDTVAVAVGVLLLSSGAGFFASFLTGAALVILIAHLCGLYDVDTGSQVRRTARSALAIAAVALPAVAIGGWMFAGQGGSPNLVLVATGAAAIIVATRLGLVLIVDRLGGRLAERVLVVGECEASERLVARRGYLPGHGRIVGQIVVGEGVPCVPLFGYLFTDFEADAPVRYPTRGIDRVVILRAGLDDAQLTAIVKQLEALSLPVHVMMSLPGETNKTGLHEDSGWVLRERPITPASMVAKRCLDLLVSGLALLFLLPLLIIVGVVVRLDSPGPALFRQTRLGRSNEPFTVFKFRTMRADAHATDGSIQAVRGDERITRVGAFLRKTSIDELPQLLNVLNGSMSLVGPRPHPTELNKKFMPLIESYAARHRIAPGITGWAQVNGFRGETRTVEQMQKRVELDLEYIRDRSVAFDLWILLRTVVSVFAHRNAAY